MDMQMVLEYFSMYGALFLFGIVFLEYMNLPGLPAGIIMPAAGILVAGADMKFSTALIISVIAGMMGSYVLYFLGYFLGNLLQDKYAFKYPKLQESLDKAIEFTDKHGNKGVFIARLLPVVRTIIALTAGMFKMKFWPFTLYSIFGITIWNFAFIYAGYAFGYLFLK
ncbi:MAG: DedA family protein [Turicibacter sp.]